MKKHWALNYLLSTNWRLWSDWVDAQADLSFRWVHMSFCWFCCVVAHISYDCCTHAYIIWASAEQNHQNVLCPQQRLRSACASAQSDQRLCYVLMRKLRNQGFCLWQRGLFSLGKCPGWSESSLAAQVILLVLSCTGWYRVLLNYVPTLFTDACHRFRFFSEDFFPPQTLLVSKELFSENSKLKDM